MNCNACGHTDLDVFLDLGLSPIADNYTTAPNEDVPRFPLRVATCGRCRLAQLAERPPADVLFGSGYSFYSSTSPQLVEYHKAYADDVWAKHPDRVKRGVLEIGCNDGDLLQHFRDVPHLGVDPSTGPANAARERGLAVMDQPFTSNLGVGWFGVVIANHVLAHVDDVNDVLRGIAGVLDHDGVAIIEVQYLPDLLTNNAFDFVYHEHANYFSLTSLARAAAMHGLALVDAQVTDRQHGSLRATFGRAARSLRAWDIWESETWLSDASAYAGVQGRAERIRTKVQDMVGQFGTVAVYGAPAKATTLLNFCGLTDLPWCVDTTPAKWGRHIPGTTTEIVAPKSKEDPDAYLLAVWNYARSVMRNNPGQTWIVPLPGPVVL